MVPPLTMCSMTRQKAIQDKEEHILNAHYSIMAIFYFLCRITCICYTKHKPYSHIRRNIQWQNLYLCTAMQHTIQCHNKTCQCSKVNTIKELVNEAPTLHSNTDEGIYIWNMPYCFIADSNSVPYCLDTRANWFIYNTKTAFTTFKMHSGGLKGIGAHR